MGVKKRIRSYDLKKGDHLNYNVRWWSLPEIIVRLMISYVVLISIGSKVQLFGGFFLLLWTMRPFYIEVKNIIEVTIINWRLRK